MSTIDPKKSGLGKGDGEACLVTLLHSVVRVGHVENTRFEQDLKEIREFAEWIHGQRAFQDKERPRKKA